MIKNEKKSFFVIDKIQKYRKCPNFSKDKADKQRKDHYASVDMFILESNDKSK